MDLLQQALRGAGHEAAPVLAPLMRVLIVGAGGALGSAVLAEALVAGRFQAVAALVAAPLASTLRGLQPLTRAQLDAGTGPRFDAAVVVFDRVRRSNGRDDAFEMPEPAQLVALARRLHERGVSRLVIVMPHAPALLPAALAGGLASLDEAALAALGFEHLVILRAAQDAPAASPAALLQRLAQLWLSQLRWMVPQRQQPLRAVALARCIAELLRALPGTPPGTRVIAPEALWDWVQQADKAPAPTPGLS